MNNLANAAMLETIYDKLEKGKYIYTDALIDVVRKFPIVRGTNTGKGFEALENSGIFRQKQTLASKLNKVVAEHLKEDVPAMNAAGVAAFFDKKGISEQYRESILKMIHRGGKRRATRKMRKTRRKSHY